MSIIILYANVPQTFPFAIIPSHLLTERLCQPISLQNTNLIRKHQARWVAHFLLWQAIQHLQLDPNLLTQIQLAQNGRPEFKHKEIDFNISHSGDWVALILCSNNKSAVGIDIEFVEKQRNYIALMEYFASPTERDWFIAQPNTEASFYRCWCLREAILKSQGAGIAHLSEVQHFPDLARLYSNYCPPGSLVYTQELPFYLAYFATEDIQQAEIFQWQDQQLIARQIENKIIYQVNSTDDYCRYTLNQG